MMLAKIDMVTKIGAVRNICSYAKKRHNGFLHIDTRKIPKD